MRRREPSSRMGGARAWARVDWMEAVLEVTLWNAFGNDRWREGCFGREDFWGRGFGVGLGRER